MGAAHAHTYLIQSLFIQFDGEEFKRSFMFKETAFRFIVGKTQRLLARLLENFMAGFLMELYDIKTCFLGIFRCANHSFASYASGSQHE